MSQTDSIADQLPQAAPAEGLPSHEVALSDVAAGKVRDLLEQEGRPDLTCGLLCSQVAVPD